MKLLRYLPNFVTLGNLLCGCLGVVWAFSDDLHLSVYMIWLAALLDFADGMVARLIGVSSELGKQLDSLADMVSFGLLPSVVLFVLIGEHHPQSLWPFTAFLIVIFSALRLANFNIDQEQSTDFKGLPTPANAILISSFPALIDQNREFLGPALEIPWLWVAIIVVLSYLMVSRIRLFGLKFKNFRWQDNKFRYILIVISVSAVLLWQIMGVPVIVLAYLLLSIIRQYRLA